jgi:hypothetical protein
MQYIKLFFLALMLAISTAAVPENFSGSNSCFAGVIMHEIVRIEYVLIDNVWYQIIYYDDGETVTLIASRPVD